MVAFAAVFSGAKIEQPWLLCRTQQFQSAASLLAVVILGLANNGNIPAALTIDRCPIGNQEAEMFFNG